MGRSELWRSGALAALWRHFGGTLAALWGHFGGNFGHALGPRPVAGAAAEGASSLPHRLVLEVAHRVECALYAGGARVGMEQVGVALRAWLGLGSGEG